jgi:hypothetical protein
MDTMKALKRAWETTWRYRALWIFGVILALTIMSWSTAASYGRDDHRDGGSLIYVLPNGDSIKIPGRADDRSDDSGDIVFNYKHQADDRPYCQGDVIINYNPPDEYSMGVVSRDKEGHLDLKPLELGPKVVSAIIAIGIGVTGLIALLSIAAIVARYVAETALIRMVADYEETGQKHGVRQGFRMGWSRTAFRLFLINLLVGLPATLAFILLFLVALAPVLLWITESTAAGVIGTLTTVGLFFPVFLLLIAVTTVLTLLIRFFWRTCALEELGVLASIRQGLSIVRRHLKDVAVMWGITLGVRVGWTIATITMAIMLFPAIILLIIAGGVLAGLPALLVGGLAGLVFEGPVPWVLAGTVGVPIFFLVVAAPWLFLDGLREVFLSSTWTTTYRELRALESLQAEPGQVPELDAPGLAAAPVA